MFATFKWITNDWELDIFQRKSHVTCFRLRTGISLDLYQPIKQCTGIYSKPSSGLRHLGSEGYCSRHMGCGGGGRGRGEEKEPAWGGTPKLEQRKDFLSASCSLSFIARIFEQKLTVRRNPLLALLHFQLLVYSLFVHLGPSYLHNEKRFGGEEGHVSIVKDVPC